MFKNNKNLLAVAAVAVVNALGYGIIIPILYSYSLKYGLSDFENGLLFSVFSICQFISTPVIGRLSDKFGRKPLLVVSILGTAISFFMAAFAPSAIVLFLARALDGLTAGNLPVASAVISDTTSEKDRARGFGIIGASFGFGFIFGPAISAAASGFGLHIPFIIAGAITLVAVGLTIFVLEETNKHIGEVKKGKLFDMAKLAKSIVDPNVGLTLLISLIYSTAFGMLIYGYQPFAVKILNLSPNLISLTFTIIGVVGLLTQLFILPRATKYFGDKRSFSISLFLLASAFLGLFFVKNLTWLIPVLVLMAVSNSSVNPLIQTILSKETDAKSQGSILGLNASYVSIGTIFGPIIAGAMATFLIPLPFFGSTVLTLICFYLSFNVLKRGIAKESAF